MIRRQRNHVYPCESPQAVEHGVDEIVFAGAKRAPQTSRNENSHGHVDAYGLEALDHGFRVLALSKFACVAFLSDLSSLFFARSKTWTQDTSRLGVSSKDRNLTTRIQSVLIAYR